MTNTTIPEPEVIPTTLRRLKQRAKTYKKTHGTTHHEALELVAREHGYGSYSEALEGLKQENPHG